MDALRQTPGVTGAAFANQLPACPVAAAAPPSTWRVARRMRSDSGCAVAEATPGFLSTMRIPLRAGRLLNKSDRKTGDSLSVLLNETAARRYLPARNPIGAVGTVQRSEGDRLRSSASSATCATTA